MTGNEPVCLANGIVITLNCDNLLQCTGLKDKNGTLIYEEDIVDVLPEDEYGVIEWDNITARYAIRIISEKGCADFDNYYGAELEVIGNIYENPELLKGQND